MTHVTDDQRNDAQDALESSYGYNAKGELVFVGKRVTPEIMAWMEQMQKQKNQEALVAKANTPEVVVIDGEEYEVVDTVIATGELYNPGHSSLS